MLTLNTAVEIAATPQQVWDVLIALPHHAQWNPMLKFIAGSPKTGEKLVIRITLPEAGSMTIRPVVLVVDPPRELRWRGRLPIPGLFSGEHYFIIEPSGAGAVRFIHGEIFRGLLVPLFSRMLNNTTRRGYELMNEALKSRVEGRG